MAPGALVIVEGVSATRREVTVPWALRIWVDTPAAVRLRRARHRDGPQLLEQWTRHWIPSEQAWAAEQDPQAHVDLIVSGGTGP